MNCPVCGKNLAGLAVRYRQRHLEAEHRPCPECGRLFISAGLTQHRRTHARGGHEQRNVGCLVEENRVLRARYDLLLGYVRALEDILTADQATALASREGSAAR